MLPIIIRESVWYFEGPKQNNAKIIILRDFKCAVYFTEMLPIIIINCYQWLSAVFINGYQL